MTVAKSKASKHSAPLLGKYELGRLLDCGTCAKVYHARSLVGGEAVAIKVLDKPGLGTIGMDAHVLGEVSTYAARRVFPQLVSTLIYCDARDISHHDVKTQNVLLNVGRNLKVCNFGLAALPESNRA